MLYTSIYFDDKFNDWLSENGVALIMDVLSYFPLTPIDTTSMDTMIDGLAEMALNFPMARLFWWYNINADVDWSVTPRPSYPADGRKIWSIWLKSIKRIAVYFRATRHANVLTGL